MKMVLVFIYITNTAVLIELNNLAKYLIVIYINEFNIHFNLNTHLLKTTKYQLTYILLATVTLLLYINMHV
jgi:hypothetical protein